MHGKWSKVHQGIYRVTRYDRKTGRLVNVRPGYHLIFTVKGDRMTSPGTKQKGFVPATWDRTISVRKGARGPL